MAGNRGGHGAVPFVHLRLLLRGPVFPPLPSTQVNAPSPRLLSWHPALPGANGVSAVVGGTCCETWWDFPLGCLTLGRGRRLGSGCCREHPLVGAGHRDLLFTGLYLLITGGEMGSHLWTSQRQTCIFWAWLEVDPKWETQKISNINFFFSSFDIPPPPPPPQYYAISWGLQSFSLKTNRYYLKCQYCAWLRMRQKHQLCL